MKNDYSELSAQYPEFVSGDQLYHICHICKRKAKWLLDNGVIPFEDTGKKTHRYRIRPDDVMHCPDMRDSAPAPLSAWRSPDGLAALFERRTGLIADTAISPVLLSLSASEVLPDDALVKRLFLLLRHFLFRFNKGNNRADSPALRYIKNRCNLRCAAVHAAHAVHPDAGFSHMSAMENGPLPCYFYRYARKGISKSRCVTIVLL